MDNDKGVTLFIDALDGTGMTLLINLLLANFCKKMNIALAVALSGIASTFLDRGEL